MRGNVGTTTGVQPATTIARTAVRGTCRRAVPAPWSRPATRSFLIDAGRGATIRLYQLKLPIGRIDVQFLTHYHSDHTSGVPDVWLTGWQQGRKRAAHPTCVGAGQVGLSGRRQQACAADRPAAPCSSTPSSCHQVCSAWRAAPQAPPGDQQGDLFWAKRIGSWKCSASPGAWFDAWVRGPAVGGVLCGLLAPSQAHEVRGVSLPLRELDEFADVSLGEGRHR